MLLRKLWIDIAAPVEPFVRAISEFAANQESVAPYRFRRAYPSRPDFTSGPNIKAHCVKDRGVVRHFEISLIENWPKCESVKGSSQEQRDTRDKLSLNL
jgi:hypothetical protein